MTARRKFIITGTAVATLTAGLFAGLEGAFGLGQSMGVAAAAGGPGYGGGGGGGGGGPGGGGGGPGGGGGEGEETSANNLSVPTIFVPGVGSFAVTCGDGVPSDLIHATGDPSTGYPIDLNAFYYVQGENTWQAQCETAAAGSVTAIAAWGDNLTGSAKLSANQPIRVEVVLSLDGETTMGGFTVVKLQPAELDRNSAYGTLATQVSEGVYSDNALTPFSRTGVYDEAATLKIYNAATPGTVIVEGLASAEINATGSVVYGYNLRVPVDGYYVLEFATPNVTISGADAGTVSGGNLVSLMITVGDPSTTPPPVNPPAVDPPAVNPPSVSSVTPAPEVSTAPSAPETLPASGSEEAISEIVGNTQKVERALAVRYQALSQLNRAIGTTNRSIHKFHNASVWALKHHLSTYKTLAANVQRLEVRLHNLLQRRQGVVGAINNLQHQHELLLQQHEQLKLQQHQQVQLQG